MTIPQREGKEQDRIAKLEGDLKIAIENAKTFSRKWDSAIEENKSLKLLLKSAHEIIISFDYGVLDEDNEEYVCEFCHKPKHLPECEVGQWLASYGKIKAE